MIRGSCLCGGIRFEVTRLAGPFELCHCSRCRKVTGSAFAATIGIEREALRLVAGRELLRRYDAPLVERPPPYRVCFCARCGSPVPDPDATAALLELPAGLLDDDPVLRPERHIFVNCQSPWFEITDRLPTLDEAAVAALRGAGSA